MKTDPWVTITILNYNGFSQIRECLKAVLKMEYSNFRVIVADNGSGRNEARILSKEFKDKRLKFIRFAKNLGFSRGHNEIIRRFCRTDYVFILDNDVMVNPECLKELIKVIVLDSNIAAVAAKVRSYYQPEYFDPSACGGFLDGLGYPYARGRIGFYVEKDEGQYNEVLDIFWGAGGCLLLRREAWEKAGFLPESFFYYHEETDFCWRLKNFGYRIESVPKAVVYHKGRGVSARNLKKRLFFIHRNSLYLLIRNLSIGRMVWVLPLRFLLDWLIGFYYLFTLKPHFFVGFIIAYIAFFLNLPRLFQERWFTRKMSREAEREMRPFCIFWEYFIHKVRRYSELSGKYTNIPVRVNDYIGGVTK